MLKKLCISPIEDVLVNDVPGGKGINNCQVFRWIKYWWDARQQLTSATRGGDLSPVHAIDPHIVLLVLRRSTRRTRSPLQYGDSIYVPDETGLL